MKKTLEKIRKFEFEGRIFFSLGFVVAVCLVSFLVFPDTPPLMVYIGNWLGATSQASILTGFSLVALVVTMATLLRMWAGTVLSSPRVMSFKIQKEVLATEGPYLISRNPIYLADLICFFAFAFCLPPVGIALPILLFTHYTQLIIYEEKNLNIQFGAVFEAYTAQTPRFIPSLKSLGRLREALADFRINWDGARHNAQYILLIPGFIVSAFTGNLLHAILIGAPAVLDWALVHTLIGVNPRLNKKRPAPTSKLSQSKVFKDIIYAQCWEDPELDRKAFATGPKDVVFSITSGGCNTLAFLIDNPSKVIALDLSPYQNYLLDLKMAAFRELPYPDLLAFMGVVPASNRLKLYAGLRRHLQPESLSYWDGQLKKIENGIIHCGRYEGYMQMLKKWLKLVVGKSLPEELFSCQTTQERQDLYDQKWNNLRWRAFTRIFLGKPMMTMLFTGKFFEQLEASFSFGDHFRALIKRALITLPLRENYFLAYILLGKYYSLDQLPLYLQKRNYGLIRSRLDRIEIVTGNCAAYFRSLPEGCISRFNFSNIFEWMDPEDYQTHLQEALRVATDEAVFTYRNLLVPRSRPTALANQITSQKELADSLYANDRSFVYKAFIVEKITKKDGIPNQNSKRSTRSKTLSRPAV